MGNVCGASQSNVKEGLSAKQWLEHINKPGISAEIGSWTAERSCHEDNVRNTSRYYLYFLKRGDYEDASVPGHIIYTRDLKPNIVRYFCKVCQDQLSGSGINDTMFEYAHLVLCMRKSIEDILADENIKKDKDILNHIMGFCLCMVEDSKDHVILGTEGEHVLYIDKLCSHCNQGGKILRTLETLSPTKQQECFGDQYKTSCLDAIDSAIGFYDKQGYKTLAMNTDTNTAFMVKHIVQSAGKFKSKGRKYTVRIGSRGGKYILVNGKKIYIRS